MAGPFHPYVSATSKPFFYPYWKKSNLLGLALVSVLCSLSYLLGVWQHNGGALVVPTSRLVNSGPCTDIQRKISPVMDFSSHHSGDDASMTVVTKHYPPCNIEFSEYTPCEDTKRSLNFDRDKLIYRERHCPKKDELLKCRVPAPFGYKYPFQWPRSREYVWYANVPHKELTVEKAVQNWIRFEDDRFKFPGGGTMFPNGADAYIDDIGNLINLKDGSIRTAIDTGCGVASWGAYLLSRNILTVSFAPRDTHEAQVQFALERGVPALIGVMASIRLPYPSRAFDMAHCSRCLIPWGQYDGLYLIEVDRILRPGGYWILSGPPINWKKHWKGWARTKEDLEKEQTQIETVAKSLCWNKLIEKGDIAIWQKPTSHINCKNNRKVSRKPQFCSSAQNPDKAWYTKLETCITPLPEVSDASEIAGGQLAKWPERLDAIPPRISSGSVAGVTEEMFRKNTQLWNRRIGYYKAINNQLGQKGKCRNLLDMNAYLGGFAAALADDPVWVMNIVPTEARIDTLGIIYERGLIGTYQSWTEAMSTYPRTYDLIHADSVFSLYENRCEIEDILLEMDRILRPEGSVIIRDDVDILVKVKNIMDGMNWDSQIVDHEDGPHVREKILLGLKLYWTAPESSPNQEPKTVS
ncbi:hypothetical protein NE237_028217 [Protea cynaroides]|uniref:Methyltransferase n=1 Tax=Protea cynaroides TaxID=273540 RepID=A0A9Q0GRZ0_9MAGN|nr:hypothetical protein NE237_028217 [Protea cynaroides]